MSRLNTITTYQNVRFLIISDTHGQDFFSDDDGQRDPHWVLETIPEADVVLHCGDLTKNGSLPDNVNAIEMLSAFKAERTLVIPGNHDRTLDATLMQNALPQEKQTARKVLERWTGQKAQESRILYLNEGLHTISLSSGVEFTIFVSPYTPEFNNWAFGYPPELDRFDVLRSSKPDIVMTHGPPHGFLDSAGGEHLGCRHLLRAVEKAQPQLHCFGHIHAGSGAQLVDWAAPTQLPAFAHSLDWIKRDRGTLLVNAAVVDQRNRPCLPAPWKVELCLPIKKDRS